MDWIGLDWYEEEEKMKRGGRSINVTSLLLAGDDRGKCITASFEKRHLAPAVGVGG